MDSLPAEPQGKPKNTGVGRLSLLQIFPTQESNEIGIGFIRYDGYKTQTLCDSLQSYGLLTTRLLCPGNFPGKNIGVSCHFFLQGIFLIQELNLCFMYWQADSLPLHHLGSSQSSTMGILVKRVSLDTDTHRKNDMNMKAETSVVCQHNKEHQGL